MNPSNSSITVELLSTYNTSDAAGIGQLLPHLNPDFSSDSIPEELLQSIIDSPSHDQLVARDESGHIVGIATLSITIGIAAGRKAFLEDFVVSPETQGQGVGGKLWDAILDWCREHRVSSLNFTSNATRTGAHAFYLKHGATQRATTIFEKTIS